MLPPVWKLCHEEYAVQKHWWKKKQQQEKVKSDMWLDIGRWMRTVSAELRKASGDRQQGQIPPRVHSGGSQVPPDVKEFTSWKAEDATDSENLGKHFPARGQSGG